MPHDHYQTVQEIADRLKVSEATVRHWIKDGSLRAIDIGKGSGPITPDSRPPIRTSMKNCMVRPRP